MRMLAAVTVTLVALLAGVRAADPPLRLYVFDGGTLASADMSRYRLTEQDVTTTKMAVTAFLVVHPRGTLMWDAGAVPDDAWKPTGQSQVQHLTLPDGQAREVTLTTPLLRQLKQAGFTPEQITYLALSHYHWDHTANANAFARATWLARPVERAAMFAGAPPVLTQPSTYASLRASRMTAITTDDYDVFGDGAVVIKLAPGHTPGHQVLVVKLPRAGPIVLSGDLYHYPAERALGRVPTFEADQAQTVKSRAAIEAFLVRSGARLWIQHDLAGMTTLRKAPAFYD